MLTINDLVVLRLNETEGRDEARKGPGVGSEMNRGHGIWGGRGAKLQ